MALLYLASTLYHALPRNRAKRVLQVLDHAAIFLMIAGTHTPFTLGVLRGTRGWALFGLVWLRMPSEGLFRLLAGGVAYAVGVVFYAAKRVRYGHFVWRLFVIAGTACHFIAVLRFAV